MSVPDDEISALMGSPVVRSEPLHGGMVAQVRFVELADGLQLVAKRSDETSLAVEAEMLAFLSRETSLPVPAVLHATDDLLLLEYVEGTSRFDSDSELEAAVLLSELHDLTPEGLGFEPAFGLHFDTLVGPLPQVNAWDRNWTSFYREQRLQPIIEICRRRDLLPPPLAERLERLLGELDDHLDHDPMPGLIHGDVWAGNVLALDGSISAFLDPAIYFADPEIELAFIELFGTFGDAFEEKYGTLRPRAPGYEERRRDVYQLYPLLVHLALFGAGYAAGIEERLSRLGT